MQLSRCQGGLYLILGLAFGLRSSPKTQDQRPKPFCQREQSAAFGKMKTALAVFKPFRRIGLSVLLLLRLEDNFATESIAHDLANVRAILVTLHLLLVSANYFLSQCVCLVLTSFHRRQVLVLSQEHEVEFAGSVAFN